MYVWVVLNETFEVKEFPRQVSNSRVLRGWRKYEEENSRSVHERNLNDDGKDGLIIVSIVVVGRV